MKTATMELEERFELPLTPEVVWEFLCDPRRAVVCIPGAELGEELGDGVFEGRLTASLGPTIVTFSGSVRPEFDHADRTGTLVGNGEDRRGRSKAQVTTTFSVGPGTTPFTTELVLTSKCMVVGGIAPFVSTGGRHLARRMLLDFADNVVAQSGAPDGAPGAAVKSRGLGLRTMARVALGALRDTLQALLRLVSRGRLAVPDFINREMGEPK